LNFSSEASVLDLYPENLLLGGGVEDYEYLNKSRREVDGVDDNQEWLALRVSSQLLYPSTWA
jgi:myosin heavy subunit